MKEEENERKKQRMIQSKNEELAPCQGETVEAVRPPEASLLLPESEDTALNR